MKKIIAWLVLAGWVVLILGVLTIIVIQEPSAIIPMLGMLGIILLLFSIPWAIEVIGEDEYYD
jgi:Kef-type K+ transport system membrane component KefB